MDSEKIKKYLSIMDENDLKRLRIKGKDFEIELEKKGSDFAMTPHPVMVESKQEEIPPALQPPVEEGGNAEVQGTFVPSPMVGTYYATPSPDDPAFIQVGDQITADTVVCIIEAMKVMNEVKAGVSGKVAEILVENGHPVEFGTKLIRVT